MLYTIIIHPFTKEFSTCVIFQSLGYVRALWFKGSSKVKIYLHNLVNHSQKRKAPRLSLF